jgi:hypothetical protein
MLFILDAMQTYATQMRLPFGDGVKSGRYAAMAAAPVKA